MCYAGELLYEDLVYCVGKEGDRKGGKSELLAMDFWIEDSVWRYGGVSEVERAGRPGYGGNFTHTHPLRRDIR
jgi:hypothetical protein